jgi:hypothetical protein
MRSLALLLLAAPLAACGGDDEGDDGTPPVGPCTPDVSYFGELFDLAAIGGGFQGIAGAVFTVDGSDETATTAPNGRIELCVAPGSRPVVTVDAPGDYLDGRYTADADLYADNSAFLAYAATSAQLTTLYATFGGDLAPDPTRGQLLVEVRGGSAAVSAAGVDVAAVRHFAGGDWTDNDAGTYALFVNVEPGTAVVSTPGAAGGGPVPITAGGWSMTTVDLP